MFKIGILLSIVIFCFTILFLILYLKNKNEDKVYMLMMLICSFLLIFSIIGNLIPKSSEIESNEEEIIEDEKDIDFAEDDKGNEEAYKSIDTVIKESIEEKIGIKEKDIPEMPKDDTESEKDYYLNKISPFIEDNYNNYQNIWKIYWMDVVEGDDLNLIVTSLISLNIELDNLSNDVRRVPVSNISEDKKIYLNGYKVHLLDSIKYRKEAVTVLFNAINNNNIPLNIETSSNIIKLINDSEKSYFASNDSLNYFETLYGIDSKYPGIE